MRGSAIGMGEILQVSSLKTRMPVDLQVRLGWDATDQEHDTFERKIMVFVWCRVQVSAWDRRRTLATLQKDLAAKPLDVRGHVVRNNAEIVSDRRAGPLRKLL